MPVVEEGAGLCITVTLLPLILRDHMTKMYATRLWRIFSSRVGKGLRFPSINTVANILPYSGVLCFDSCLFKRVGTLLPCIPWMLHRYSQFTSSQKWHLVVFLILILKELKVIFYWDFCFALWWALVWVPWWSFTCWWFLLFQAGKHLKTYRTGGHMSVILEPSFPPNQKQKKNELLLLVIPPGAFPLLTTRLKLRAGRKVIWSHTIKK